MLSPYYQDKYATIYHGDCLELLPEMPKVDLVLTDPPYGIGEAAGKNKSRGLLAIPKDYGYSQWDKQTNQAGIDIARNQSIYQVIWGGNYYNLPPSSCWLIWDKENGKTDFADCELAWTNLQKAVRIKRHGWNGMLRKNNEPRWHPTQKPLEVIIWAARQVPDDNCRTIFDPFMGSGTTLVAAKQLNRQAIGIEIEEKYCEIAAKRLSQEVFDLA